MGIYYSLTIGYGLDRPGDLNEFDRLQETFSSFKTLYVDFVGDQWSGEHFDIIVTLKRLTFHEEVRAMEHYGVLTRFTGIELTSEEEIELTRAAEILGVDYSPHPIVAASAN